MIYAKFQKHSRRLFFCAFLFLIVFAADLLRDAIPDEIYVVRGEEKEIRFSVPVTVEPVQKSIPVFGAMMPKEQVFSLSCKFLNLIPVKEVSAHLVEKSYVMPSGVPVGIYTQTKGILVIGIGKVTASDGLICEPADQIIKSGDYIIEADGIRLTEKEELIEIVNASGGDDVVLSVLRGTEEIALKIKPAELKDGSYKLGIWVRDDMAGVGTLTYIRRDMTYGALGHPVSDGDTGNTIRLKEGSVYHTDIVGIVKGENGTPGELTGVINYKEEYRLGTIERNTKTGIYGRLQKMPQKMKDSFMEAAMKQEIKKGEAFILSSLDGNRKQYAIQIDEVNFHSKEENKGILFHVTDERLLSETGGIVQGMSGSPILQNGKVIGAVTHVFVKDSARGYGVFIENMLEQ